VDKKYGNIIWTTHALNRMSERGIKQSDAFATWKNPERSRYAKAKAAWVYHKNINGQRIEIVAKKNEKGEWIVLSVWSKQFFTKEKKKVKNLISCIYDFFRYNKNS
jgi:hypothetical protein